MPSIQPVGVGSVTKHFLAMAWGGGDGPIRNAGNELIVEETDTPNTYVTVGTGSYIISEVPRKNLSERIVGPFAAPSGDTRIDLIQWTLHIGPNIVAGSEGGAAPSAEADSIPLATVTCPVGMSTVKNTSDGTNAYITDARSFL